MRIHFKNPFVRDLLSTATLSVLLHGQEWSPYLIFIMLPYLIGSKKGFPELAREMGKKAMKEKRNQARVHSLVQIVKRSTRFINQEKKTRFLKSSSPIPSDIFLTSPISVTPKLYRMLFPRAHITIMNYKLLSLEHGDYIIYSPLIERGSIHSFRAPNENPNRAYYPRHIIHDYLDHTYISQVYLLEGNTRFTLMLPPDVAMLSEDLIMSRIHVLSEKQVRIFLSHHFSQDYSHSLPSPPSSLL